MQRCPLVPGAVPGTRQCSVNAAKGRESNVGCHFLSSGSAQHGGEITDAHTGLEGRARIHPFYRQTLRLEKGKPFGQSAPLCNPLVTVCPAVFMSLVLSLGMPQFLCHSVSGPLSRGLGLSLRVFLPVPVLFLSPAPLPRATSTLLPLFQDKGVECGGPTQPPDQGREPGGTLRPGPFPAPKARESEESRVGSVGGVRDSAG